VLSAVLAGTVNVAPLKLPLPVEVVPDNATVVPPNLALRVELGGKFDPDSVTVEPTTPWAGLGLVTEVEGL
jgi:hypothetical protein